MQVRKHGSPTKYTAKVGDNPDINACRRFFLNLHIAQVVAVSHDCDLALLGVQNEEFWEGMPSLELGDVPELQDEVVLAGCRCWHKRFICCT